MERPAVFPHDPIAGHALLDCGDGEKLERFGPVVLRRPDPQAMWRRRLPEREWAAADLSFERESDRGGQWVARTPGRPPPDSWTLEHGRARFVLRPTPFKHVGLFPEQSSNWRWTAERLAALRGAGSSHAGAGAPAAALARRPPADDRPTVLNLFGYTGAATVCAAQAGAFVTHVDASRPALRWAKENAALSGLPGDAVRWICDDALTFVAREQRRGRRYAGILLDPPPYGRGPDGQKWTFEEGIVELLGRCAELLTDGPAFLVLSCYAVGTTPLAFQQMLSDLGPGAVEAGELAIPEHDGTRLLPAGLCGRWCRDAG